MFILEVIIISTILFYFKVKCPVGCAYCFEEPTSIDKYDIYKMVKTFSEIYEPNDEVVLHGGEVCTIPIKDLEHVLLLIRREMNNNKNISLQTSLYGLTNEHLRIFKKYNVSLGISIDGPPEFNILRGPRDKILNDKYQEELIKNIYKLKKDGFHLGYITVLSKVNAGSDEKVEKLIKWLKEIHFSGRLNPMFVPLWNAPTNEFVLSPKELGNVWIKLAEVCLNDKNFQWQPIREFVDNLMGTFHLSPCIVSRCDYQTTTCKTIMGDGSLARCDRCFQEGYFERGKEKNYIRSDILRETECFGCKYFEICGGGCPGEGIEGDSRHKTYYCESYYSLYEYLENKLRGLMPNIKLSIDYQDYFENYDLKNKRINFFENFGNGTWRTPSPKCLKCDHQKEKESSNRPHGDHYDDNHYNTLKQQPRPHGDHYDNNHYNNINEEKQ